MIPTNIFHRVLHLAHGDVTATGTLLHVDNREYLATSKHFAELLTDRVEIFYNNRWTLVAVHLVGHNPDADVSVVALAAPIVDEELSISMTLGGMTYGGDVYFMGFPFGLSGTGSLLTRNFPIPFVKRAIVANFASEEFGVDFWLDGHNNVGFSGGPIISVDPRNPGNCTLRGFICSYYTHPEVIYGPSEAERSTYQANSGLIMAAKVDRALTMIAINPIGPVVQPPFAIYPIS